MESEFEPLARTEETSAARVIILDLPGFRKEDLRVQLDNRGNLIIRGEERRVKETEETGKVRGALEKMQRGGRKFRKIMSVPENLNVNGITAKFKDETLHITLPLLPISDQQNQKAVPESRKAAVTASGKTDQAIQSKVERSSTEGQEESMKERSGVAQDDQREKQPEAIRQEDDKPKGAVAKAAEVLKGLEEERKPEAHKIAQDVAHGKPPISKDSMQKLSDDQTSRHPEVTQPEDQKAKPVPGAVESKELVEGKKTEAPKHAEDFVGSPPISKDPVREISAAAEGDQSARDTKANRPDDDKLKAKALAEESKEPVSKEPKQEQFAVTQKDQSPRHPEEIQPADLKETPSAAVQEPKESPEKKKEETPKQAKDFVHEDPTILSHTQAVAAQTGSDRDQSQFIQSSKKDEEKLQQERNSNEDEGEQADDEVEEETGEEEDDSDEERGEEEDESDERRLPLSSDEFPQRVIQIPSSSGCSIFSKEKVLLAATVLALSVGLFLSHILSSRSSDLEP